MHTIFCILKFAFDNKKAAVFTAVTDRTVPYGVTMRTQPKSRKRMSALPT